MGVTRRREFLRSAALAGLAGWGYRARAAAGAEVVIVGAGFGGGCCALALRALQPHLQLTLIDAQAQYVTCPMSNEALIDLRPLSSLRVSRAGFARAGIRLVTASATAIDAERRRVRLADGGSVPYDRLVVAPGIRLRYGTPEGYDAAAAQLMPHAWVAGAQTALLHRQLQAMADGGTVAISVPGGLMRCPPGPYERASLLAAWLRQRRPRSKLLIFDANNHFPRQDVFTAAWQHLYPGTIEWLSPADGGEVTRVDAARRTLFSSAGAQRVAVANVIPAQAPGELAQRAGLASGHGWCPVDPLSFESQQLPQVHVIGDACIAGAMPKAASAAASQARQCAAAIVALLAGQAPPAPSFDSVCYSHVSRELAFAIRGRFTLGDAEIRQLPHETRAAAAPDEAQAQEADAWYQQLRAQCFGMSA